MVITYQGVALRAGQWFRTALLHPSAVWKIQAELPVQRTLSQLEQPYYVI